MSTRSRARDWIEYIPASLILKSLGLLPRRWAIEGGLVVARLVYYFWVRLRKVGLRNLELIFPELADSERRRLLKRAFQNLGRLLGEFSQFPKFNRDNIREVVVYKGLENYHRALAQGRGVLILTAHFGAWELSSFAHSLYGYPMHFLVRRLDNPLLDRLIESYRTLGGNLSIDKKEAARRVLTALRRGETVGILMDLNTQPHEGVFCDFMGLPACTSPIIAHFAARTNAAVIPGFLVWDEQQQLHKLHFEPPVELVTTGDQEKDLIENTERLNDIIASFIRRYPDQWLWVHKRWQTRPPGSPDLYSVSNP